MSRIDPIGLVDVLLQYIVAKNKGTMTGLMSGEGCSPVKDGVEITINGVTKMYTIGEKDSLAKRINGHIVIDNEILINDFMLHYRESTHQAGDSFLKMDDTALAWALKYNELSIGADREFFSYIYKDDEGFKFTQMQVGDQHRVIPTRPTDVNIQGMIHTHGAYQANYVGEEFSTSDINSCYPDLYGYLSTPGGKLKKFDPFKYSIPILELFAVSTITDRLYKDPNYKK